MQQLIKEYGRTAFAVLAGGLVTGLLGYACYCIAMYLSYFAEWLMGG